MTLSQQRTQNLISANSIKVLGNKLLRDFNNAIFQVSQVYSIGNDSSFEINEEQFVALLFTLGIFKEIRKNEESLYNELL